MIEGTEILLYVSNLCSPMFAGVGYSQTWLWAAWFEYEAVEKLIRLSGMLHPRY